MNFFSFFIFVAIFNLFVPSFAAMKDLGGSAFLITQRAAAMAAYFGESNLHLIEAKNKGYSEAKLVELLVLARLSKSTLPQAMEVYEKAGSLKEAARELNIPYRSINKQIALASKRLGVVGKNKKTHNKVAKKHEKNKNKKYKKTKKHS